MTDRTAARLTNLRKQAHKIRLAELRRARKHVNPKRLDPDRMDADDATDAAESLLEQTYQAMEDRIESMEVTQQSYARSIHGLRSAWKKENWRALERAGVIDSATRDFLDEVLAMYTWDWASNLRLASHRKASARLAELRLARRKNVNQMSPEDADEMMSSIGNSVGVKAHQMVRNLNADRSQAQRDLKILNKAWSNWDWKTLASLNLLSREDLRWIEDFNGEYSRRASTKRQAAEDARWFKGEVKSALDTLEEACDTAGRPGGLSDDNGTVSKAVRALRGTISRDLNKLMQTIK